MRLNGSQIIIECLVEQGVDTVFGYPGGAVLNIYDEIYKQNYFRHILTRHEQGALHAADGYARASGKVGVAIVTSGPGFTNAVTGIATAFTDSIPLVIISGQVPLPQIGTDSFQEIDAVGISRPCTKHNYLVKSIEKLENVYRLGIRKFTGSEIVSYAIGAFYHDVAMLNMIDFVPTDDFIKDGDFKDFHTAKAYYFLKYVLKRYLHS